MVCGCDCDFFIKKQNKKNLSQKGFIWRLGMQQCNNFLYADSTGNVLLDFNTVFYGQNTLGG